MKNIFLKIILASTFISLVVFNSASAKEQVLKTKQNTSNNIQSTSAIREINLFNGFFVGVSGNFASQIEASVCSTASACYGWDFSSINFQQPRGYFGTIDIGYNYRIQDSFLLGLEANISKSSFSDEKSQWSSVNSCYYNSSTEYNNLSTATLKMGYILGSILFYARTGIGLSDISDTFSSTYASGAYVNGESVGYLNSRNSSIGYAIGGGVEYAFNKNWSIKADYIKINFPTNTVDITIPVRGGGTADGWIYDIFKHDLNVVRVGINYNF